MPKRPRQHQLEDESRTAFRSVLPSPWVFRDSVPDYGIDGEVEIFDSKGFGTGKLFKVQLKATDEPKLDRALSISLRIDTCNYYDSIGLPVLIVRYHKATRTFYAKWFHNFDPYYGKRGKTQITFRFTSADMWNEKTPEMLVSELNAIDRIKSPQISTPITITLTVSEKEIHGIPSYKIITAIRNQAARLPGVLDIIKANTPLIPPSITISNDKVTIDLANANRFILHTSAGYPPEKVLPHFPSDVLIGVALALEKAGHFNIAARLAGEFAANSSIIKSSEIVVRLARCMARAQRITEAFQLSEKLFDNSECRTASQILSLLGIAQSEVLSAGEREFIIGFMKKRAEDTEKIGNPLLSATAQYNCGNYIRSSYPHSALRYYRKASKYDPRYLEKDYYWHEIAGILFDQRHYSFAASFYERAKRLRKDGKSCALLADSLMFSGKYEKAQKEFEVFLAANSKADSEWRLKAWALGNLRKMLNVDEQKRQVTAALTLIPSIDLNPIEARSKLIDVLRSDALCSRAWFNLGVLESQAKAYESASFAFLVAALTSRGDIEAWTNAMALTMNFDSKGLGILIIQAAYQINGARFHDQMIKFAESQPEEFPKIMFLNLINETSSVRLRVE
jgi:tetratricopeptide (TPR) repeat protein